MRDYQLFSNGEDFYFLQNLAKYGTIGKVEGTTVYPSMRISNRVPFGTGRKMGELADREDKAIPFYKPEIFRVVKDFISLLDARNTMDINGNAAIDSCKNIDSSLHQYLESVQFAVNWDKIKTNSRDEKQFRKNLHVWFDAFKTLKLIHYLRDNGYGMEEMMFALGKLLSMLGMECDYLEENPEEVLQLLRSKNI